VQPTADKSEWQIQQDTWGTARISHVTQKCLCENCPQIIEKEHTLATQ